MRPACCAVALVFLSSSALAQADIKASLASALTVGETFTIQSQILGELRRINVYLPPAYAESTTTRLPVLYMPDGGMGEDFLHVAGLVQVSVGNGTMRPFLLVGIENTQRRRDLTGPTQNDEDKKIAPVVGGSAAFRQFIHSELMPAVNARYRTTTETAIMGESAAGLFVVETFFLQPDLFDTYIAFDPSLWWNNNEWVHRAAERLGATGNRKHTLYLASSSEDFASLTTQLADVLETSAPQNLTWHYEPMPNETHATIYHPAALLALRRLFNPRQDDGATKALLHGQPAIPVSSDRLRVWQSLWSTTGFKYQHGLDTDDVGFGGSNIKNVVLDNQAALHEVEVFGRFQVPSHILAVGSTVMLVVGISTDRKGVAYASIGPGVLSFVLDQVGYSHLKKAARIYNEGR